MKLRPLHDGIVVTPDPPKRKVGRIHLIDSKAPRVMTGTVVRTGKGRLYPKGPRTEERYKPCELKTGDRIAFLTAAKEGSNSKGVRARLDTEDFLLGERDALFVIELEPGEEVPEIT